MRHSAYKAQPFRFDQLRYGYGWTCVEQGAVPGHVRAFIGDREIDYASLCDAMIKSVTSVSGLQDVIETQDRCNATLFMMSTHLDSMVGQRPQRAYFIDVNTGDCLTGHEDDILPSSGDPGCE